MTKAKKTATKKAKKVEVVQPTKKLNTLVLLDRSGSMGGPRWIESVKSINSYMQELKNVKTEGDTTVAIFDSDSFDIVNDHVSLESFEPLVPDFASPRGMTPLFDSVGRILDIAEKDNVERTAVVIVTDGAENASREHNSLTIKTRLETARARNWQVLFLGADFETDNDQYTSAGATYDTTLGGTVTTLKSRMVSTAHKVSAYGMTGESVFYNSMEKAAGWTGAQSPPQAPTTINVGVTVDLTKKVS